MPKESEALTFGLLVLAWVLYSFGHYLDNWIFDPFYRPWKETTPTRWERITQHCPGKARLEKTRSAAAIKLACSVTGLYGRAAAGFQKSEEWEKECQAMARDVKGRSHVRDASGVNPDLRLLARAPTR